MSAQFDNVYRIIFSQLSGATITGIYDALGQTLTDLHRQVLNTPGPADYKFTEPATALNNDQWVEYHGLIVSGTLARMMAQVGRPWTNLELAKAHRDMFDAAMSRAREFASSSAPVSDGYTRVIGNLRFAIPEARDPAFNQELFNTIDEFKRNTLQVAPPNHTAAPSSWMTSEEYGKYFRLLIAGTLSRMYRQPKKPWSDERAAAINFQTYNDEVLVVRGDSASEETVGPSERIIANLRATLPGVKDAMIHQELFNVVIHACRYRYVWVEPIEIKLSANRKFFDITQPDVDIVRVQSIVHPSIRGFEFDNGKILAPDYVTEDQAKDNAVMVAAFAPSVTIDVDKPDDWIPKDLWGTCYEAFRHKALSNLMLQKGKPYTDMTLGKHHGEVASRAMLQAARDIRSGGITPAAPMFRIPRFR